MTHDVPRLEMIEPPDPRIDVGGGHITYLHLS